MHMLDRQKGILAIVIANISWGATGYYFNLMDQASFLEVLAHRIFWSFVIFSIVLLYRKKIAKLFSHLLTDFRTTLITILGCLMISVNWVLFIFAVQNGMATEASMGYFMFPLVAAFVGYVFFKETFSKLQFVSVGIAFIAVVFLTFALGALPWIPLLIASSFCAYGIIKRGLKVDPIVSVTTDVMLVMPLALVYLIYLHFGLHDFYFQPDGLFASSPKYTIMFIVSGLITAGPLMLLSYATKRLPYTQVGLISYINPTLQFLVATFVIKEVVSTEMIISFILIWSALILYSFEQFRLEKSARR